MTQLSEYRTLNHVNGWLQAVKMSLNDLNLKLFKFNSIALTWQRSPTYGEYRSVPSALTALAPIFENVFL
jgi:hypothetical protein